MTATLTPSNAEHQLPAAAQDAINERLYRRANLVSCYSSTKLYPSEATVLVRYREDLVNRRILDLGCGAGRLATFFRPHIDHYVGLDISPYMVTHCRRTFAGMEFVEGDMRDLSQFDAGSFDAIFAVSNLIDAVTHEDRLRVFQELRRVLANRGLLVFSSHNRNHVHAGDPPQLTFHRNPWTQLRSFADYIKATANHRRIRPLHRFESDYALLNDSGNNYNSLHYYVSREVATRQLDASGFEFIECLDELGRSLTRADDDRDCPSLLYVARRSEDATFDDRDSEIQTPEETCSMVCQ